MLILNRRVGESVVLLLPDGRAIVVTNIGIDTETRSVRLGFEAPSDVRIVREELEIEDR